MCIRSASRRFPTCLLTGLALLTTAGPSRAQLDPSPLTITAREWDGDFLCREQSACSMATGLEAEGTYVFCVYAGGDYPARDVRFGISMPPDYTVLDWESCQPAEMTGDPGNPAEGLRFRSDCFSIEVPLIQFLLECPTPGRVRLAAADSLGGYLCEYPDPGFIDFWSDRYVDVGQFCGRFPQSPCGYCPAHRTGSFPAESWAVSVEVGGTVTDTLAVTGYSECLEIPECGGGSYTPPCYGGLDTSTPWIGLELLEEAGSSHTFRFTFSGADLEEGSHVGWVEMTAPYGCCAPTCLRVDLEVVPPNPVRSGSWGGLKGIFGNH